MKIDLFIGTFIDRDNLGIPSFVSSWLEHPPSMGDFPSQTSSFTPDFPLPCFQEVTARNESESLVIGWFCFLPFHWEYN